MKARILLAEDEANIRLGLIATLESEGYEVVAAGDGAQALRLFPQHAFDLVILDIMMPKTSGYDVCRELRSGGARVPVLFLSAKAEEIDKVVGLKLGADDYVTKPFGVHELLARVEALLRRARSEAPAPGGNLPAILRLGAAAIDRKRFLATVGDREVALTARELKLAEVFVAHPDEVLARDTLLNAVWGVGYFGTTRTLDQHVAQLRKKIEECPESPTTIVTVHGIGYRYDTRANRS
ncbi:MAG: response regulator transcription factor [Verrucomicrobia bacterium]|nr:response regulator transcription factor [Verrucomicrobiota bacterium]